MNKAIVFNIQRYCLHDGDGIRTTFFFKGCPLACLWCHNPEGMGPAPQLVFIQERCRGCGRCSDRCVQKCIGMNGTLPQTDRSRCTACGECGDMCPHGAREIAGRPFTVSELVQIAQRDESFYRNSGGGVTLSGGEVMMQDQNFLLDLVQRLHQRDIGVAVDTCGHADFTAFLSILPYVDTFLYDVKFIDRKRHKAFTGQDNDLILSNLQRLSDLGARLHIRVPVIVGANAGDEDMDAIIRHLKQNIRVERVSLLPFHGTGSDKRARLGLAVPQQILEAPSERHMDTLRDRFRQNGFHLAQDG